MTDNTDDLRQRHEEIMAKSAKEARKGSTIRTTIIVLLASVSTAALVWGVTMLTGQDELDTGIPVSRTTDFPDDRPAQETLDMPDQPSVFVPASRPAQTDSATLARITDLEQELAAARERAQALEAVTERERALQLELERERDRFQSEVAALRSSAQNDQDRARETETRLQDALQSLSADIERQRSADAAERQAEELRLAEERRTRESEFQRELDALRRQMQAQLDAAQTIDPLEEERLRLEALRLQQDQEQRAALQAERERRLVEEQARIDSGLVALSAGGEEGQGSIDRVLSAAERFVNRGIAEVPVSQASRIALPSATVPQGTIVQASLETAIDSSLPGVIRAVVSEDVHSLDGSSVLIPAGSKLFGEYDAGIELGQRRILIAWTRVLTPSNRSISIASYGADDLGRSGTDGTVDTRFWTRFGNAAAISIIGGGAAAIEDRAPSNATGDTASDVAGSVDSEASSAIGQAFSIAPRIYVRQGSSVSVILDRDLEIL